MNTDIFVKLKERPNGYGDTDYLMYMSNILHSHKWLDCEVCGELKVIKKGHSFVRVMKKLGWIYKPSPKKSSKRPQRKLWQCPECQQKISLDEYLEKNEQLSELARLKATNDLTDSNEQLRVNLTKELAKVSPWHDFLSRFELLATDISNKPRDLLG